MCVKPNCLYGYIKPPMILSKNVINNVESQKNIGVTICSSSLDDIDILQQCKSLYGRGNTIIKAFDPVLMKLNVNYLSHFAQIFIILLYWTCLKKNQ